MIYNGILSNNKKNDTESCPWCIMWGTVQASMFRLIPFGEIKPPGKLGVFVPIWMFTIFLWVHLWLQIMSQSCFIIKVGNNIWKYYSIGLGGKRNVTLTSM